MKIKKRHHIVEFNNRISFWTKIRLKLNGKLDGKKGCIKYIEKNYYTSPYIQKEINLFLMNVEKEKLKLNNEITKKLYLKSDWDTKRKKAELMRKSSRNGINDNSNYYDAINSIVQNEHNFQFLKTREMYSKQFSDLLRSENIEKYIIESKGELIKITISETELFISAFMKCNMLYDLLLAKLSIYWGAVVKYDQNIQNAHPLFIQESVLDKIYNEIKDLIDKRGLIHEQER